MLNSSLHELGDLRNGSSSLRGPSNLPRGFQRFGFVKPFRPGGFSNLG